MFEKKKCRNCGEKLKDDWKFCPHCGESATKKSRRVDDFDGISEDMTKEFERMNKMLPFGFKVRGFKIKPEVKGGVINIVVHGGGGMEPRMEIRTSDDYKKFEPRIKRKVGVGPAAGDMEEERIGKKKIRKLPKVTEEPETNIQVIGNKHIIEIKLPGVDEDDIEIKRLENSIELKAFSGSKAYFKLIPVPSNASVNENFKNGVLKLEIER